ncbi:ribosomal RNA small subunit methyltransferase E [Alphaproteobacteria bacterium]|nr:ribosomal RNA small subunit methyltransferase E [Alphaproteobacteria bacterium]GHS96033.1 ribosomal RNA small subunit methyltransferase E [Alphaproteobacteria bacterium]
MTVRLFVPYFQPNILCPLPPDQAHYVVHVMRLRDGDLLHIFNESLGEFEGVLKLGGAKVSSKSVFVFPTKLLRTSQPPERLLKLAFSPLKPQSLHFLVEKATELGVTHLQPLQMTRTQGKSFLVEKMQKIIQDAAEQSERLTLPRLEPLKKLKNFWEEMECADPEKNEQRMTWFVALEREDAPLLSALRFSEESPLVPFPQNVGIIIGPEGGFSPEEKKSLPPCVIPVSLGKYILRAETAAVYALSFLS